MMLLYIILVVGVSFFSFINSRKAAVDNCCFFIVYCLAVFIIGCRFDNLDYSNYVKFYVAMNNDWQIGLFKTNYIESFFYILAIIEKTLIGDVTFFFLIFAAISLMFKFLAFKKMSPYVYLSILLYSSNYFFKDYIQIRNGMCSGIFLYSIIYMANNKMIKYNLFNYLAIINHAFGWSCVPIIFIQRYFKPKFLLMFLLFSFVLSFSIGNITHNIGNTLLGLGFYEEKVLGRIANDSKFAGEAKWFSFTIISFFCFSMFLIYNFKRICDYSKYSIYLIGCFIYGFSLSLLTHDMRILSSRFIDTFCTPELCILLPMTLKIYTGYKKRIILLLIYAYAFYNLTYNNGYEILNYKTILLQ